ncbi:MAG: hypothetical protein Q9168_007468 [Polycauliona sp. 1 TL-2023]
MEELVKPPQSNICLGPPLEKEQEDRDHSLQATSALSLDDLEAAQALEGLRADCALQPRPHYQSPLTDSKLELSLPLPQPSHQAHEPEPLLALFTAQHPILSTAINGSLSAYTSSKSFSPSFKYGAELVERHVGSPVVSTVRTAGKYTGLETGVRWFLDGERRGGPSRASKRRRTHCTADDPSEDVEPGLQHDSARQKSIPSVFNEDLPPYDDERSPLYEQHDSSVQRRQDNQSPTSTTWRTRLVMSTSGLGVAMSEESLRNLRYCLSWLRWGNDYLNRSIRDLQDIIREYNSTDDETSQQPIAEGQGESQPTGRSADRKSIGGRMHLLKSDIVQTMSKICQVVSQYTGGALPANARSLVHAHLTALPGRFAYVLRLKKQQRAPSDAQQDSLNGSEAGSPAPEPVVDSAHRVLILASEGMDMIAQISNIVDGTITSAEEWCNRLGRKSSNMQQQGDKETMEQVAYPGSMNGQDEKEAVAVPDAPSG